MTENAKSKKSAPKKRKPLVKEKTPMPVQEPEERIANFSEVALGYTKEEAVQEAKRCLQCKTRKCVDGCPVEVPIPEFIQFVTEENFEEAYEEIAQKNILPAICGRVCPQENQCERVCTLGKVKNSQPVAIGRLERFIADWAMQNLDLENKMKEPSETNGIKVAVIGSGPAGLTCASELSRKGYEVTIFEAFHEPGGVLVYGIPEFRLPKDIVKMEINTLAKLGVEIKLNQIIGKIFTLDDLREQGYKAFFIGVGAGTPRLPNIKGMDLNGVLSANEFLTRVNLMKAYREDYNTPVDKGNVVAVIGGGNVAMDSARTALRLGAKKVMIIYRRTEKELPARWEEYEHAQEEGIEFHFLKSPLEILGDERGFVKGLRVQIMKLGEPDSSGRARPVPIEGEEEEIAIDMIIIAIGSVSNKVFTQATQEVELNKWGYLKTNEETGQTSVEDVFAGGDIVTGAATVISALGMGKKAAEGIDQYIHSLNLIVDKKE